MRLTYLMNTYPVPSGTFIRREIRAHEAAGQAVDRFAVRRWGDTLVDPADREEAAATHYLLSGNIPGLIGAMTLETLTNPVGVARAARSLGRLMRASGGRFVPHMAYLMQAAALRRACRANGTDHIHAHFSTNSAAVALLCRRMGGPEYSFTVHGPDELEDTAANGLPEKVGHAGFVAAISHYCKGRIANEGGPGADDKTHIVRCGIEIGDYPPRDRAVDAANRTLVCVGRLCTAKAQTLLVPAVAALKAEFPDLRLVLIGDGDTRAEIEAGIAEHALEAQIQLAGWATNAEVRAAIAGARAFVLPSYAEGLPVVIMEALAMETPVISTRITGIPELLDESCGWVVEPGDVDGLTAALRSSLEAAPDQLLDMGRAGRDRVIAQHDQSKTARDLRALIPGAPA